MRWLNAVTTKGNLYKLSALTFLIFLLIYICTPNIGISTNHNVNVKTDNSITQTIWNLLEKYSHSNLSVDIYGSKHQGICPNFGEDIETVFVVISTPTNKESRYHIRKTWGSFSSRRNVGLGFVIGSTEDKHVEQELKTENDFYGDLIRTAVLDTYKNLTLKTTLMLNWVTNYCNKARYIFKVDDDVFINVELLMEVINQKRIVQNRSIYGRLVRNVSPIRDKKSKYYISPSHYASEKFPDFTTGPAYIFPSFLAQELYNEALNLPFVELEDVFYTGIVASRINVSLVNIPEIINFWLPINDCNIARSISLHDVRGDYLYYLWFRINNMGKNRCKSLFYVLLRKVETFFNID